MDLVELKNVAGLRHPWELARVEAVRALLSPHLYQGIRVLDMGCGDGFVSRRLFSGSGAAEVTAVDINLSEERIRELQGLPGSIRYLQEAPAQERFDLLLVMDVIEHIEDDRGFLDAVVARHLAPGGKLLLTVPSFQFLFGHHDVVLGHYRRYRLAGLEEVATSSAVRVLSSGYLFGSLLLPKLVYNKVTQLSSAPVGVGSWQGGKGFTSVMTSLLRADNSLLLTAARLGIKIPGLSAWALCQKP